LPALRGYNGTTPKATARVALLTARGDPLLATWQFGLGRAAVWTSDLKGQWATDWLVWNGFNTFVAQLTNWVLPQPNDVGLQTAFVSDGEHTTLQVVSTDLNGQPRDVQETQAQIVAPDGSTQTLKLNPNAPGIYRAPLNASTPGVYLAQITQRDAQGNPVASATMGLVVPYSPEYKFVNQQASVLPTLARATNGRALDDPAQTFIPFAQPAARTQPIWMYMLLAAALLFPLDVAARRLRLARSDWERVHAKLRVPQSSQRAATGPRALEGLFSARERVRVKRSVSPATPPATSNPTTTVTPPPAPNVTPTRAEPSDANAEENMTERLRRARERARKSRR
jgi:hypothetical protein